MSDNFFDENIRKKLESVRPEFSEAAWKKLKKSLPVPWYLSFLRDFGSWMFGGVATVAFLTTYYNNQNIKKENQLLNEKISTINQSSETKLTTDTMYIRQSDTVYLTRYITRYISPNSSFENEELVSKLRTDDENLGFSKSQKTISESTHTNKTTNQRRVLDNKSDFDGIIPKEKQSESLNSIEKGKKVTLDQKESENRTLPSQSISEDKEIAMVLEENASNSTMVDKTKITEDKTTALTRIDSTKETKLLVDDLIIPDKKQAVPIDAKTKNFSLKNINIRGGISGDYMGEHSRSMGPAIEVFLGERFGFNTGLLLTGKTKFEYMLPRDFNMGTGKKFEDRYKPFIEEKPVRIQDIQIQSSSIKLPLFFNYYIPLKYRTSFMLTTGTKLNISEIETVEYTGQDLFGTPVFNKFEKQYKPKVFNNLFYGMGFQYQYKRLAGQFSPYFEFPFGQATYLVKPKKFGMNASLKFNLNK